MQTFPAIIQNRLNEIPEKVDTLLKGGDALVIIPPFFRPESISLGAYSLKSSAEAEGFTVDILQADQLLAYVLGPQQYIAIQEYPLDFSYGFITERLFSRSAFGLPPLGHRVDAYLAQQQPKYPHKVRESDTAAVAAFTEDVLLLIESICNEFVNRLSAAVSQYTCPWVGISISFESQVSAGIALITGLKSAMSPATRFVVGGTFGEYGREKGLLAICPAIDHLIVGPGEGAFISLLKGAKGTILPQIIQNTPTPLSKIPLPDYEEFTRQTVIILGQDYYDRFVNELWYESDRGCWWADKVRCTFCSIADLPFQKKDTAQIVDELARIHQQFPTQKILFAHNIIWDSFLDEFEKLKRGKSLPPMGFFIRVRPELSFAQKLKNIGCIWVFPGIESFSTRLLKRMKKGTTGRANLYFLRNAHSLGIDVRWLLLWGFPNDTIEEYDYLLDLVPKISHLKPPVSASRVLLMKGAPYVSDPQKYHIEKLRPWPAYQAIYPPNAPLEEIANHFDGDYTSGALDNMEVMDRILAVVHRWQSPHHQSVLEMIPWAPQQFRIQDRRLANHTTDEYHVVSQEQAIELMSMRRYQPTATQAWGVQQGLGIAMDGWFVPIITASPEILYLLDQTADSSEKVPVYA
ncbi:MAG: RiPP maturation radical SAM C-methyltransferase [Bacteroidota bacterium]